MRPLMTLIQMHDALGDLVSTFHNEMLRLGTTSMLPEEWLAEFCAWADPAEFNRRHRAQLAAEGGDG